MHSPKRGWTYAVTLAVVTFAVLALSAPVSCAGDPALLANGEPLATGQLIYQEAPVAFQLDVNGAAAVQLLGPALDAAVDALRQQLPALTKGQPPAPGGNVNMAAFFATVVPPLIDPAKQAIKSITRVALLAMKPGAPVPIGEVQAYYQQLMAQRGWTPLATMRTDSGEGFLLLLAPGGKGIFGVIRPNQKELVVGMITTAAPVGDLIAPILRVGAPLLLKARAGVWGSAERARGAGAPPAAVVKAKSQALAEKVQTATDRATAGEITWAEAEKEYLAALADSPQDPMLREYVGRLYTRWGRFEKALQYLSPRGGWSSLNYAFCMDALGRRAEAMPVYEELARDAHGSAIGQWATLGLHQPTWPKDLGIPAGRGEVRLVPNEHWHASAWAAEEGTKPELAIDNNRQTEWETRGHTSGQEPGEWFRLDFDAPLRVTRIVLDHYGEKSIYTNEWARGLSASVSKDGVNWRDVPVSPASVLEPAQVRLGRAQPVKGIKFTTTAHHAPEWWGIYEVFVFGPAK